MKLAIAMKDSYTIKVLDTTQENPVVYTKVLTLGFGPMAIISNGNGGLNYVTMKGLGEITAEEIAEGGLSLAPSLAIQPNVLEWVSNMRNNDGDFICANAARNCISDVANNPLAVPSFATMVPDAFHISAVEVIPVDGVFLMGCYSTVAPWQLNFSKGGIWYSNDEESFVKVLLPSAIKLYNGRVYVLESGTGSILSFDTNLQDRKVVIGGLPGFLRGLDIDSDGNAYVTTSKIPEDSRMYKFARDFKSFRGQECVVYKINLSTGNAERVFQSPGIIEINDICIISE